MKANQRTRQLENPADMVVETVLNLCVFYVALVAVSTRYQLYHQ